MEEKEVLKEHLQRKREQHIHQEEKLEQMKCTIQNTEEEIEQLEYALSEMEHMENTEREPRIVPNDKVKEAFAYFCRVFDYLQRRLRLSFHYKLVCEILFSRYKFRSRSHIPGREYLSFATVLTYFKRERVMVNAGHLEY